MILCSLAVSIWIGTYFSYGHLCLENRCNESTWQFHNIKLHQHAERKCHNLSGDITFRVHGNIGKCFFFKLQSHDQCWFHISRNNLLLLMRFFSKFFLIFLILLPITEYQLRQNIFEFYSFSVFNGRENFHRVWRATWLQIILISPLGKKLAIGVFCLSVFNNIIQWWCELKPVHSVRISSQLSLEGLHLDSLKSVTVGEFRRQKLENTTNQGFAPLHQKVGV